MSTTKHFIDKKKCTFKFLIAIVLILMILQLRMPPKGLAEKRSMERKYVVHSSKCKIKDLDPFDPEILPFHKQYNYSSCNNKSLLTYVKKKNDVAVLYIDEQFIKDYTNDSIHCCYSTITRTNISEDEPLIDATIKLSHYKDFQDNLTIPSNFIILSCRNSAYKEVYRNTHATAKITNEVKKKMQQFDKERKQHLSVLFIGIDSISRMNLIRSLPSTHLFLKENDWLEFKGYNKIGDNTFPNVMALLTGLNETTAWKLCNPTIEGSLDKCKMIWYDYRDLGYITAYAEDEIYLGTFNYLKKGFKKEPTDYYFRPYMVASEKFLVGLKVDDTLYCSGPEVNGERILNLARDFVATFKDYPTFGFFWMNSYSHNNANGVSRMDKKILIFLTDLAETGILENSFVIFLSDHGFRFGPVLYTHRGWLENRLPFLYMSIPKWFKKKYPDKYQNMVKNTERLISPYDVYMTLQDILILSGKNYTVQKSNACPKCKSLFIEAEKERSCEDAGIEHHWCACHNYVSIPTTKWISIKAAKFITHEINKMHVRNISISGMCSDFKLEKVLFAGVSQTNYTLYKNISVLLITLQTDPLAVFQATISLNLRSLNSFYKLEGGITRLDKYGGTSNCVKDSILEKYCYCTDTFGYMFQKLMDILKNYY